jgi:hypothetical protein
MDIFAQHDIIGHPSIRLVITGPGEYEVQVNEATGYDHLNWVTVRQESDFLVALHHYAERLVLLLYKSEGSKAPAVTNLYPNMFG